MLFYVKDRKTFKTKAVLEGVSWKLVRSVWTDLSEIVAKDDPNVSAGDFVYNMDGWVGLISDLERNDNQISLKIEKIERLFQRQMIWYGGGYAWPCEQTLYVGLLNYKSGAGETHLTPPSASDDSVYALPYLTVSRQTLTAGPSYPLLDKGLIKISSYISQCRRLQSVFTDFTISGDTLTATIEQKTQSQKTLITTNFPCVIKEESFSETKVAKVTTYKYEEGDSYIPTTSEIEDWYLMKDGTISNDPDSGTREEGDWEMASRMNEDDATVVAQNVFAKNAYSHKLIIQMQEKDARYDFYDLVRVEVGNHIYDSYVSRKTITSDGLVEYTFGDLKTSLMDKINEYD